MTADKTPAVARKPSNVRTALVLLSIAAVFFASVVLKRVWLG
jgi:hypothetical protein